MTTSDELPASSTNGDHAFPSLQDPVTATTPQTEDGVALLDRLDPKWIVVFVFVAVGLSVLIAAWLSFYVAFTNEDTEKADFDQLARIVDPLQAIATLMIGTIFGVAVQGSATAVNKVKADKNKKEADDQHQQAQQNADRAQSNAKVAALQADTASDLRDLVLLMREHYVTSDSSKGAMLLAPRRPDQATTETPTLSLEQYADHVLAKADRNILPESRYRRYLPS